MKQGLLYIYFQAEINRRLFRGLFVTIGLKYFVFLQRQNL